MFPNVNGWTWTPLHIAFLSIFFTAVSVIATTVLVAMWRARRNMAPEKAAEIQWHSAFEDLPERDRSCRHEFTGEFDERHCERGFDCRGCTTHAKLAVVHPVESSSGDELFGLHYPADRMYHRGHTWVRDEGDGTVTIGPDDLSRKMFGRFERLELPAAGTRLRVNAPAWSVRHRGDEVRVLSPVEGEVVETGSVDSGFYLRVKLTDTRTTHLLRGAEVRPWVMRELERLQILISPDPTMPALADGGVLVDDAPEMFPDVNWPAVWGEMLLEP